MIPEYVQKFSYRFFNKIIQSDSIVDNASLEYNIRLNPLIIFTDADKFNIHDLKRSINTVKEFIVENQEANNTFYKKWTSVIDKSRFELYVDQILHYWTTYGLNLENPYYPENTIKELPKNTKVTIVKTISLYDFIIKIENLVYSNISISDYDILDIKNIIKDFNLKININKVQIKEIKIFLYDYYEILPDDPEEFLKFLYYKISDSTLLVKSESTIDFIKNASFDYFEYFIKYDIKKLATIFNRYKSVFMAIKLSDPKTKSIINKISKLSKKLHVPYITPNYLKVHELKINIFKDTLDSLDTRYIVKIYNYLNFKKLSKKENNYINIYRIRNEKYFINNKYTYIHKLDKKIKICKSIIEDRIKDKIKILNFKLNSELDYAIPTTGKQFINNIPYGSIINVNKPVIIGIYWENYKGKSIDLDLSVTNNRSKIGWNSSFYNDKKNTIFSGDITDAKNGASELMYINEKTPLYKVNVNFYNYIPSIINDFSFKFYIANSSEQESIESNYMIDTDNIIYSSNFKFNKENMSFGTLIDNMFIFDNFSIPNVVEGLTSKDYFDAIKIEMKSKLKFSDLDLKYDGSKDITELSKDELLTIVK